MQEAVGRVESINLSGGGVPKTGVLEALVTETGLDGDRQANRLFHGGRDRAAVLFSLDVIEALQREGHPIGVGTTGENLTISGLEWRGIVPGVGLRIGEAVLLVTKYTSPCETIRRSFLDDDFSRVSQDKRPGWSRVCARVVTPGVVRLHDSVRLQGL